MPSSILDRASGAVRLLARGVDKSFGATAALRHVELEALGGEVHAIIGENGAGKSTLMHILAGTLSADSGTLELDGQPYSPGSPLEARKLGVALVSQELAICPHLSVFDNVMLGQETTRRGYLDRTSMHRQVLEVLGPLVGDAAEAWARSTEPTGKLSVPNQQLVEIARALVGRNRCRVLILDEPTSSLGRDDTARLFDVVRRLATEGITVLYISHFLEEVQAIASHFTVLRDGATVGSGRVEQTDLSEMVRLMAGRKIDQLFSRSSREQLEVVLELDQLAGDPYPSAASLELRRGEVFGVAGLVGAGRTELLRAIYGLGPVRSGRIRVKTWHGPSRPEQRVAQGVGLLSEDRKGEGLAASLSVAENLTLSKLPASRWGWLPRKRQNEAARTWADKLAIKLGSVEQPVGSLSGGNQQKVALGRLLHQDADVLLLDEPTRGIDVGSKAQVYEIIDELARQGKAVLMVSSYMPELLGMCDTIAVMRRGRLGPARPREQWSERALLEAATGGAT